MGRFACYGVYYGKHSSTSEEVHKKVFDTWDEAKPYTKASNSKFKGFNSKESAEKWFDYLDKLDDKDENKFVPYIDTDKSALMAISESTGVDMEHLKLILNSKIINILRTHSLVPINGDNDDDGK